MNPSSSARGSRARWAPHLALALALALGAPAEAPAAPLVAGGVKGVFGRVESFLSDRAHMIQLAVVGMAIGLFILMRK